MTERTSLDRLAPLRGSLLYEIVYMRRNWTQAVGFLIPAGFFLLAGRTLGGAALTGASVVILLFARNLSTINRDLNTGIAAIYLRSHATSLTLITSKWLIQYLATTTVLFVLTGVGRASLGRTPVPIASIAPLIIAAAAVSITMMTLDLVPRFLQFPVNLAAYGLIGLGISFSSHTHFLWLGYIVPLIGGGYAFQNGVLGRSLPWTLYVVLAGWVFVGILVCAKRFELSTLERL